VVVEFLQDENNNLKLQKYVAGIYFKKTGQNRRNLGTRIITPRCKAAKAQELEDSSTQARIYSHPQKG
jgi:hypothetical protein